jgi:translation initiation factor IF-1
MNETAREGTVFESLPNATFRVKLKDTGDEVLSHLAGKMKINHIRVLAGDRVLVEVASDGRLGRIVRRMKVNE